MQTAQHFACDHCMVLISRFTGKMVTSSGKCLTPLPDEYSELPCMACSLTWADKAKCVCASTSKQEIEIRVKCLVISVAKQRNRSNATPFYASMTATPHSTAANTAQLLAVSKAQVDCTLQAHFDCTRRKYTQLASVLQQHPTYLPQRYT